LAALFEQGVLANDPDISRTIFDIRRNIGRFGQNEAQTRRGIFENQFAAFFLSCAAVITSLFKKF